LASTSSRTRAPGSGNFDARLIVQAMAYSRNFLDHDLVPASGRYFGNEVDYDRTR
jgi:hypothetical protein